MGRATRVLAAAAAVVAASPLARADEPRVEAGAFLGGDYFGDNVELGNSFYDDQVPGLSALFGLRAGYRFSRRFGAEVEGKLAVGATDSMGNRPSITTTVLGYRVHGMVFHRVNAPVEIFGVLGVGAETSIFDRPPDPLAIDNPDTDTAICWGAGATYALGSRYGARLDLRQLLTAGRDPSLTLTHEVHLGVFVRLGGGATETVVVERVVEKPVEVPAPTPEVADSDGDGFPDDTDKCPKEPEVVNSIDDDDGCPEVDSDNDGMLGSRDACPDAAEDVDGYEDTDGCPDPDNDGDGRPDRIDSCPLEAEVLNGFEDADGCPDEIPPEVQAFTGVIRGIQFRTGSARAYGHWTKVLNRAVAILVRYPSLHVEIGGHTDDRGSAEKNLELSRKRADFVKWYLVDKGIEPDRIVTVGYGPDKPIADNANAKGRAENRRIEFNLLPGPATVEDSGDAAETPAPATPDEAGGGTEADTDTGSE